MENTNIPNIENTNENTTEIPHQEAIQKESSEQPTEKKYIQLKGKQKKFDQELYEKYDIPARKIIKEKLGDNVDDNPDIYAEDMIIKDPKCKYKFIELQVCTSWVGTEYPFQQPYVYERKGNFSKKTLFIIFNRYMNKGLLFDKDSLSKEPCRIKKYSRTLVHTIPWYRVIKFTVDDLNMETIYMY